MAVNHVNVIGNLTRDAVLQNTNNGTPVLNFTIAFSESTRQSDGTYKDIPQYVDCVMFGNRAEKIAQYFTKGTKLGIDGSLRYHTWEDHYYDASGNEVQVFTRSGQPKSTKRSQLQVIVDEFEFCSSRNNGGNNAAPNGGNGGYRQQAPAAQAPSANDYDSDVPF